MCAPQKLTNSDTQKLFVTGKSQETDLDGDQEATLAGGGMLILVIGGARSGKSLFAIQLFTQLPSHMRLPHPSPPAPQRIYFLATAQPNDPELIERIQRHRAARPRHWLTIEVRGDLVESLNQIAHPDGLILDCLTLYLSQRLLTAWKDGHELEQRCHTHVANVIQRLRQFDCPVVVVTNEVGEGIVPDYPLGRQFRDLMGLVNQQFALTSDEVYWMKAGIPVKIPVTVHQQGEVWNEGRDH